MDIVGQTIMIRALMLSARPWQRISSHLPRAGAMTCPAGEEGSPDWRLETAGVSVLLAGGRQWLQGLLLLSTSERPTSRKYYFVNLTPTGTRALLSTSYFQFHFNHGTALIAYFMQFVAKPDRRQRQSLCKLNWKWKTKLLISRLGSCYSPSRRPEG